MKKESAKSLITTCQRFAAPLPSPGEAEYTFLLEELSLASALIFPEYFAFHKKLKAEQRLEASNEALQWLQELSLTPQGQGTLIFGGSVLEAKEGALHNCVPVFFNGEIIARYRKRRLYKRENEFLQPGLAPLLISHPVTGQKWGVLICADVYLPGVFEEYKQADHIAIPTASPWLDGDTPEAQEHRDREIYQKGAQVTGAVCHKSCVTGFLSPEENHSSHARVQGRSLIASPEAVLIRAPHIEWQGVLRYDSHEKNCSLREFVRP